MKSGFMQLSLVLKLFVVVVASQSAWAGSMPWTSNDYVDLYFRIYNGHVPLPHLRAEKQKVLFNHLVDPQNLVRIQSAALSGDDKLRQLNIILATLGSYRARYNYAVFVGEPLEQELAMVQAYQLQVLSSMARLSSAISPTGASHPSWITMIGGVIDAVENRKTYSPAQSAMMADAMARNYPIIAAVLTHDERNLIRAEALKLDAADDNALRRHATEQIRRSVFQ